MDLTLGIKFVYHEGAGFTSGSGPGVLLVCCAVYSDFEGIPANNVRVMDYWTARAELLEGWRESTVFISKMFD